VLTTRHFPATLSTGSTGFNAFIHTADFFTIHRTCFTDIGTDLTNTAVKRRATKLEISRCLADLSTVHHETKVFCFNMLSTRLKAVVHGGLQADLMAVATSLYKSLHGGFNVSVLMHNILLI
jgi:hypothetical protein